QRISRTTSNENEDEDYCEITAKCEGKSLIEKTALSDRNASVENDKRERMTLDSTLTRYSSWRKMRMDLFIFGTLCMVSQMFSSANNVLTTSSNLKMRQDVNVQTILCWCDNSYRANVTRTYLNAMKPSTYPMIFRIGFLGCGLSSVVWESSLGRRSSLLIALSISIVATIILYGTNQIMIKNIMWTVEYVTSLAVLLIAYVSFVEVLPKKWRIAGAGVIQLSSSFAE
ncbi:hypothetical protein PFISCL1PPCAC_5428, partial [Pristionchus fissidentatus]